MDNVLVSARLGSHLQSVDYTLRRKEKGFGCAGVWQPPLPPMLKEIQRKLMIYSIAGKRAVSEAANILSWAARHLENFFNMLRNELGFYVGCLNLADEMRKYDMPICIPTLRPLDSRERSWRGLYDVSLAIIKSQAVVGNELDKW